ncbi:T9SS type A sorting domain-containing protein [candidate division KSB1 bacterium]|nr:T9SS type A sorting domain-containing protein [candidate division KSB1 bacterium]
MKYLHYLIIFILSPVLIWGHEYEVPVDTEGNLFILSVQNPYQHPLRELKLNVISTLEWILINKREIDIDSIPALQKRDVEISFTVSDGRPDLKGTIHFSVTDALDNILCFHTINLCTIMKPEKSALSGTYPNPANPGITICYDVADMSHVQLEIYNVLGRHVRTLVNEIKTAGRWNAVWDGKNSLAQYVSSGTYIVTMYIKGVNTKKTEKFSSKIIIQK